MAILYEDEQTDIQLQLPNNDSRNISLFKQAALSIDYYHAFVFLGPTL